ncbi:Glucokinase [uncultured Defluviicoccus sp.]|uniref:Glucokinase n=1 Tax=metagenome TaxID=256318 RepID=A0A380TH40_9ZZZZ|nr:Glucokinase [uncultured Defluviicoccus sp.]
MTTILAGDIGGTKTTLALYTLAGNVPFAVKQALRQETFASADYATFEAIVSTFLAGSQQPIAAASFGVAGPVLDGEAKITNLPWTINAQRLKTELGFARVALLNDVEATACGLAHLGNDDFVTLNAGTPQANGTMAVVAPGTGIGIAFLVWTGQDYRALPTEGGHVSFAPRTADEFALLKFLEARFGHVSVERVASGTGIANIYAYFAATGRFPIPKALEAELATADDPTPTIVQAGLGGATPICAAALDLFVRVLGDVVGNVALMLLATGGIYLGGGMPPRLLTRLQRPDFLEAVCDKGRFGALCRDIPLHVVLDPQAALHGAACNAHTLTTSP